MELLEYKSILVYSYYPSQFHLNPDGLAVKDIYPVSRKGNYRVGNNPNIMARELTAQEKKRFMSLKYFGTTDNPEDDVNPHDSVADFLTDSVGNLNWGNTATERKNSKKRFSFNFNQVLAMYSVILTYNGIVTIVEEDEQSNEDAVNRFIEAASWPLV
jgi:hypothetical protein